MTMAVSNDYVVPIGDADHLQWLTASCQYLSHVPKLTAHYHLTSPEMQLNLTKRSTNLPAPFGL